MSQRFVFFLDDFGTRTTCKGKTDINSPSHEYCYALGGVIVAHENIEELAGNVERFCKRWKVPHLHGHKIRSAKEKFSFLKKDPKIKEEFFIDLDSLILDERLIAHGCVICRPGYRERYLSKYHDSKRWKMSKTAFDISVERALKFAISQERELDVVYERSGAKEDRLIESYFNELKAKGTDFDKSKSNIYDPLPAEVFGQSLKSIRQDGKANKMLQLADLVVNPLSQAKLGKENRAYNNLIAKKMLLDFKTDLHEVSIKYSCFDGEYDKSKKHKGS